MKSLALGRVSLSMPLIGWDDTVWEQLTCSCLNKKVLVETHLAQNLGESVFEDFRPQRPLDQSQIIVQTKEQGLWRTET